jgi:hypothetical protein
MIYYTDLLIIGHILNVHNQCIFNVMVNMFYSIDMCYKVENAKTIIFFFCPFDRKITFDLINT